LKISRIALDLDDVCNEFTLHALAAFGCDIKPDEFSKYKPEWNFDILKAARELDFRDRPQITSEEFWETFDRDFWAGLPESAEFRELLGLTYDIVGLENTFILTAPICGPAHETATADWCNITAGCLAGKYNWIQDHLPPEMRNNFSMSPVKHLSAAPDALLIDDSDSNVNAFRAAGGQAVVMPRPWNTHHGLTSAPMSWIYSELSKILQK